MNEEDQPTLKVMDFVSIALKAQSLQQELKNEIGQQQRSRKEIDLAVINKVILLINFITDDDCVGVARFNKITENIRPLCPLPHEKLKVDLPMAGRITRALLDKDHTSGIYKNLN